MLGGFLLLQNLLLYCTMILETVEFVMGANHSIRVARKIAIIVRAAKRVSTADGAAAIDLVKKKRSTAVQRVRRRKK